ncbi:MAG: hypothetical protein ACR2J8_11395 [Thermomicrobiales bacterium]
MQAVSTRRGAIVAFGAALASMPGFAAARRGRTDRPGRGLMTFEECHDRLDDDICRELPFYDRAACGRALDRCCKANQVTLNNASRCVEQNLPNRGR